MILFFGWQKSKCLHFFTILFELMNKLLDVIVLGAIFYGKQKPYLFSFLEGYTASWCLILFELIPGAQPEELKFHGQMDSPLRSLSNSSSEIIRMPSCLAFSSLAGPIFSPATK